MWCTQEKAGVSLEKRNVECLVPLKLFEIIVEVVYTFWLYYAIAELRSSPLDLFSFYFSPRDSGQHVSYSLLLCSTKLPNFTRHLASE